MNQQERQALRERHKPGTVPETYNLVCDWCDNGCGSMKFYPCDVIKVLDAWEATTDPLLQPENANECGHVKNRLLKLARNHQWITNDFCPKCGEKL